MSELSATSSDPGSGLLDVYDQALPAVYGYLLPRCGRVGLAEELTAETFLAAVDTVRRTDPAPVTVAWLIGVARHKLADHWRREYREERKLRAAPAPAEDVDPWDAHIDARRAHDTLALLEPQHRAALVLRYLDDLPVAEVAHLLDRTVHATESVLVRARTAFRTAYSEGEGDG